MISEPSPIEREAHETLRRFTADSEPPNARTGWTPAWSSSMLETAVTDVLSMPEARIEDLFRALWGLLEQTKAALSKPMSQFIREIVVLSFTRYREKYDRGRFEWMVAATKGGCTEAQAYLALLGLPDGSLQQCREAIWAELADSAFSDEARKILSED